MTSLLDANVLIALFDAAHHHHHAAHRWLSENRAAGWATCPLTQNACVRILSQPNYPGRLTVSDISRRLRKAISAPDHQFWPDDLSLVDQTRFDHAQILTPKQLTDLYLLAIAVEKGGRLVTFDKGIPIGPVISAGPQHLLVLG